MVAQKEEVQKKFFDSSGAIVAALLCAQDAKGFIESAATYWLQLEKELYDASSPSFEEHAKQLSPEIQGYLHTLHDTLRRAQNILRAQFAAQDKEKKHTFAKEASFAVWQEAIASAWKNMARKDVITGMQDTRSLQEIWNIPWPFMDRSYQVAVSLFDQGHYYDAHAVFMLLHFLSPTVFAYVFGEASCQHVRGNFFDALANYLIATQLEPENPVLAFQLACCYQELGEQTSARLVFDYAIECAERQQVVNIVERAKEKKSLLPALKAA